MAGCDRCGKRDVCVKLCAGVEAKLPKEYTGRDSRREVGMGEAGMGAALDRYAVNAWCATGRPADSVEADLSALSPKQRKAVELLAEGMSMRGAARRLKISLNALQSRVESARRRMTAGHNARPVGSGDRACNAQGGTDGHK